MASRLPSIFRPQVLRHFGIRAMSTGQYGDGEGKGGGSGGAVRSAGGSFGKMEAAHEEEYFRRMQKEQLEKMKQRLEDEVDNHESQIRSHMEAIERHKKQIRRLQQEATSDSD